jgi:hypothetical protein
VTTRDAIAEVSRALRTQAEVEAEQRAAHLTRFGEPEIAWVTDERNGRKRKVFLPFEAEPDLAELIMRFAWEVWKPDPVKEPHWFEPSENGLYHLARMREILVTYPQRSHWEYHAHGWAVSLSRSPCHFRPYAPE